MKKVYEIKIEITRAQCFQFKSTKRQERKMICARLLKTLKFVSITHRLFKQVNLHTWTRSDTYFALALYGKVALALRAQKKNDALALRLKKIMRSLCARDFI